MNCSFKYSLRDIVSVLQNIFQSFVLVSCIMILMHLKYAKYILQKSKVSFFSAHFKQCFLCTTQQVFYWCIQSTTKLFVLACYFCGFMILFSAIKADKSTTVHKRLLASKQYLQMAELCFLGNQVTRSVYTVIYLSQRLACYTV